MSATVSAPAPTLKQLLWQSSSKAAYAVIATNIANSVLAHGLPTNPLGWFMLAITVVGSFIAIFRNDNSHN